MNSKFRFTMNMVTVLVVFALSAILAVPALADDSAPPVEVATEEAPPAEEPAVEPQPQEAAPETIVSPDATAPEEPTVTELIEQLPEGTEVVVLDENGETLPLATQEAAEAIEFHDPMWCPLGVTPFGPGCSIDYGSLELMLNDTNFEAFGNGVVWIQGGGDVSSIPLVFDGTSVQWQNAQNFSLTFKGGWSGDPLAPLTIDANNPSVISVPITIINWNGNITLSNIVISNTDSSVGSEDTALFIETTKNIQLDNVTVEGNDNLDAGFVRNGAYLDNCVFEISACTGTGTVVINNGAFNDNEGDGLIVLSTGTVAINGLVAHNNDEDGAFINNTFALTDKAVTLKGFKHFSNNTGNGLEIRTDGLLTISNLVANSNGGDGAILNNSTSIGNLGVTLSGINYFTNNTGTGLNLLSHGNILISNLNAIGNDAEGAVVDNCDGLNCSVILAKTVKLTGMNTFSDNGLEGLKLRSFGSVTLNKLTAINNGGDGAFIENGIANGNLIDSIGTLTFTGYALFNGNSGDGLEAKSNGSMTFVNVTANGNFGGQGLSLEALKPGSGVAGVTITGVNNFSDNVDTGLEIDADGKITLYSVTANDNGNNGARIINNTGVGMPVIFYGTSRFNRNGTDGLVVNSNGTILVYSLTADQNNGVGADLSNDVNYLKPYNVTVYGTNSFNLNDSHGLYVTSFGTIVVYNLTAHENGQAIVQGIGAYLDNCIWDGGACDTVTPKSVVLSGYVRTSDNYDDGLYIHSLGAVSISSVLANGNGDNGVVVDNNNDPLKPMNVTVRGINYFNENTESGLFVQSYGVITTYNLTAYSNGDDGAHLDNCNGSSSGIGCTAVTIKSIVVRGVNSFIGNSDNGLYFDASGSVSLARVTAEENGDSAGEDGIKGYSGGNITLYCAHTINNFLSGYDLTAFAALTLKGFYSNFNGAADGEVYGTTITKTKPCLLP